MGFLLLKYDSTYADNPPNTVVTVAFLSLEDARCYWRTAELENKLYGRMVLDGTEM